MKSFKPDGMGPGTTGLLAISLHRPTPCKQLSQYTPHKSLLNCHLVAALPAGCPTWTQVLPEASEEQTGCFPRSGSKQVALLPTCAHGKKSAGFLHWKTKTTTKQSKIPRGLKEVLCCPLSDRIESPNHKNQKKNKGRKGERKGDGERKLSFGKGSKRPVTVGNHMPTSFGSLRSVGK